jgi:caa(3)-type oxidase subunit IV
MTDIPASLTLSDAAAPARAAVDAAPPTGHRRHYLVVWAWLILALCVSLGLGMMRSGPHVIAAIFTIAVLKAYLVIFHFMGLASSPRAYRVLVYSTLGVLAALFIGVWPDMVGAARSDGSNTIVVAAPSPPATAQAPVASAPGDPARGQLVYQKICIACHGPDGRGNGGKTAADFVGDRARLAKSDDDLLRVIDGGLTGKIGTMPPWRGVITAQEQRDALAYIRQQFGAP